ncbi:potassium channel family protein [Floridanema evergladense]|uniref:TrkA family potassium uptake protein n=1 Tax=Floridaenema evergladense BLCC-F167 TaxID=3153639 RepID=A0ABV4WRI9_9CYAN
MTNLSTTSSVFLVCGLGSLGQHCVVALKNFGVNVIAIDEEEKKNWEISNLPSLLSKLIIGDCRQPEVLQLAKIEQCRGVILVTHDERVNIETALIVREINPKARLVVRSTKENLNQMLTEYLGNFVSFAPTQLPASAFAIAALGTEALGFFNLEGQWLKVVQQKIKPSSNNDAKFRWCYQHYLYELNSRKRLILSYIPHAARSSKTFQSFYEWEPDTKVELEDTLIYIETTTPTIDFYQKTQDIKQKQKRFWQLLRYFSLLTIKQKLIDFWYSLDANKLKKIAFFCGITILFLLFLVTILYKMTYSNISIADSLMIAAILLLGGFGDLFGGFDFNVSVPFWLRIVSLLTTLTGTAFVGILYGFLTERILASRFELLKRRPPIPKQNHIVVMGMGRMGQKTAALLAEFKQPTVGVSFNSDSDLTILPNLPLIFSEPKEAIAKANLATAKSVIVTTDDEILNLEIGLMARAVNPDINLVIRALEQRLTDSLSHLLPNASVLCASALIAEAFAGAAFGENIISLFRMNNQTILVTEYNIEANDTLNGLLLAEIAYGYGVVPIWYQQINKSPVLMPLDDTILAVGDRLIVLATIDGLQRIEKGRLNLQLKNWQIRVEKVFNNQGIFEGANAIARISRCELSTARDLMNHLPQTLKLPLYKHQALRLVRELKKYQVLAQVIPINRP